MRQTESDALSLVQIAPSFRQLRADTLWVGNTSSGEGEQNMTVSQHTNELAINWSRLESGLEDAANEYQNAAPFPHTIMDGFLNPTAASRALADFPGGSHDDWMSYVHWNERKYANTQPDTWSPALREILAEVQSPRFVAYLEKLSGIDNLLIDETLEGAGLHQSLRGGYLNVHADFTVHPKRRTWLRRLNLLIYLNEDWLPEWGGDLELWATDMSKRYASVAPLMNRAVIFTTNADSFHGHPDPMTCPEDRARRSIALYYYTEETNPVVRSTEYRARPGERFAALPIFLDKQAVHAYDAIKRRLNLSDAATSGILRFFDRKSRRKSQ